MYENNEGTGILGLEAGGKIDDVFFFIRVGARTQQTHYITKMSVREDTQKNVDETEQTQTA